MANPFYPDLIQNRKIDDLVLLDEHFSLSLTFLAKHIPLASNVTVLVVGFSQDWIRAT